MFLLAKARAAFFLPKKIYICLEIFKDLQFCLNIVRVRCPLFVSAFKRRSNDDEQRTSVEEQ